MAGLLLDRPPIATEVVPPALVQAEAVAVVTKARVCVPPVQRSRFPPETSGPLTGHALPLGHQDGVAE
jgi:hypothetical protein